MEQKEFYALVAKMRDAQNHYFAAKRAKDWNASSRWFTESRKADTVVVLLIPARTDTKYFHKYIYHNAAEIRFIEGRLRFGDSKQGAPFPSMIVVFRRNY